MPLRPTTLRLAERTYDLIREEAAAQGIPVAQYIREAALMRCMVDRVDRGFGSAGIDLAREVRSLSLARNSDGPHDGGPSKEKGSEQLLS